MKRLNLDFHPQPSRLWPALLLLAGVVAIAWTGQVWLAERERHTGFARTIAELQPAPVTARAARPQDTTARVAQTRVAAQLAASWETPLDAIAGARGKKIALLSLDAKLDKQQIKLIAEARQLADAVAFVEALQSQPGIRSAALTQHELQQEARDKPVRFYVTLEWRP
jgi:hypothetical protein